MNLGAALLLMLAGGYASSPSVEKPECPTHDSFPSEEWSRQSRNALASHVRYPPRAMREGITGTTQLQIDVDRNGLIHGLTIANSSGHPLLDQAALDAARTTRRFAALPCLPAARIRVAIPVRFILSK